MDDLLGDFQAVPGQLKDHASPSCDNYNRLLLMKALALLQDSNQALARGDLRVTRGGVGDSFRPQKFAKPALK